MRRTFTYLLAASIAISGSAFNVTAASAAAPRVSAPATVEVGTKVEQVDRRGSKRWKHSRYGGHKRHYSDNRHYSGKRHYSRHRNYSRHRHYHRGNDGFPLALGIIGLAVGAAVANSYSTPRYYGGSNTDYCARKYRSWDPRSRTYLGYDGRRHACRIP